MNIEDLHEAVDEIIGQGIKSSKNNTIHHEALLFDHTSHLKENDLNLLNKVIQQRKIDINNYKDEVAATSFSIQSLKDFDWSLRLVLSSDQLQTLRKPLLMLKLSLKQHETTTIKHITMELTYVEFKNLLENCHQIYKVIDTIRQH